MDEYMDNGRVAEILANEYGDQGFVISSHGDIVVRSRSQSAGGGTWEYYGRIGESETMFRLRSLTS